MITDEETGVRGASMNADLFTSLCEFLGCRPERVLSVRVNRRQVVVASVGSSGLLQVTRYRQSDGRPIADPGGPGRARQHRI